MSCRPRWPGAGLPHSFPGTRSGRARGRARRSGCRRPRAPRRAGSGARRRTRRAAPTSSGSTGRGVAQLDPVHPAALEQAAAPSPGVIEANQVGMNGWAMTASPPASWIASTVSSTDMCMRICRSRKSPTMWMPGGNDAVTSSPRTTSTPSAAPASIAGSEVRDRVVIRDAEHVQTDCGCGANQVRRR